jgi:hypothetical protein
MNKHFININRQFDASLPTNNGGAVESEADAAPAMRGNVFTIEALFGALLFMLVIVGLSSYSNSLKENTFGAADEKLGEDVLIVLDKEGDLAGLNETKIQENLDLLIGSRAEYLLELKTYNYSNGAFVSISELSIGEAIANDSEVIVSERSFLSSENGSVQNYSIARLYIWN